MEALALAHAWSLAPSVNWVRGSVLGAAFGDLWEAHPAFDRVVEVDATSDRGKSGGRVTCGRDGAAARSASAAEGVAVRDFADLTCAAPAGGQVPAAVGGYASGELVGVHLRGADPWDRGDGTTWGNKLDVCVGAPAFAEAVLRDAAAAAGEPAAAVYVADAAGTPRLEVLALDAAAEDRGGAARGERRAAALALASTAAVFRGFHSTFGQAAAVLHRRPQSVIVHRDGAARRQRQTAEPQRAQRPLLPRARGGHGDDAGGWSGFVCFLGGAAQTLIAASFA
ncbi:hypothetical protein JL720_3376 [Aureococcus anophagefferens]|nr:hypothetical protein JL720_3376 [Aureococcus anophagefferens]